MKKCMIVPISLLLFSMVASAGEDEVLIAGFEGGDYGSWIIKGGAFETAVVLSNAMHYVRPRK